MEVSRALFVVLTLALGIGAILYVLIRFFDWAKVQDEIERSVAAWREVDEIYRAISTVLSETFAARVAVIRSSNGGGIPAPDRSLFSSIAFEVTDHRLRPLRENWQKVPVDRAYASVIATLIERGCAEIVPEDLPPCPLRDLYVAQGIVRSRVHRIVATRESFLFLAVNFVGSIEEEVCRAKPGIGALDFDDPEFAAEIDRYRAIEARSIANAALKISASISRHTETARHAPSAVESCQPIRIAITKENLA